MPSVHVDRAFMSVIREERDRLKREANSGGDGDLYVPESEALKELLSDDAKRRIERERG